MNPLEMTYTPPSATISAIDEYPYASEIILEKIKGYKIIAFRPPHTGEFWLTDLLTITKVYTVECPRFILTHERSDVERIDGITKLYFANNDLCSREAIDRMLHREDL